MRKPLLMLCAAAMAVSAAAPAFAQDSEEDDGRFILDAPIGERRDFNRDSPIVTVDEDGQVMAPNQFPPEIIREAPGVSLNGVRVAGAATVEMAEFYKEAFGMFEVQRIEMGENPEIMLNFGVDEATAMMNPNGDVVIYPRAGGPPEGDDVAHVVFDVTDAEATVAAVEAAGGSVLTAPFEFGDTGIFIAIVADPEGNQIELLQWP